ncbi:MAG: nuclear transport factor 2 family protein [Sphingobacteriales bacterium]|nr:nuclear transport factor 2 family protein [Sphingobacteriales bacterium]
MNMIPLYRFLFLNIFFVVLLAQQSVAQIQSGSLSTADSISITNILQAQQAAWNRADVRGFMEGYHQSDSLRFMGKSGITYGWQATLDRYLKNYPDAATMGQLQFTMLSLEALTPEMALMTGKWELFRTEKENIEGYFSLIWKKIQGKWRIVFDHSS